MSDLLDQARALETEFTALAAAEELDDARIAGVLERRDTVHRQICQRVDQNPAQLPAYQPFLQEAYANTQQLQKRCEEEREDVKKKLITLNTSKKARKAY